MNYKIITSFLVLMGLTACTPKPTDTSKIDAQIRQYIGFMDAKKSPKPQLDAINTFYGEFSDILTQAGLKSQADQYLAQAITNEHVSPYLQGVDKTFQHALVILIHRELDQAQKNPSHIDNAYALYNGLKSVVERRGKYIGSETLFTGRIEESFKNLRSGTDHLAAIKTIYTALDDVYFLSVLYEIEGITENRGVNDVIVHEKQVEGLIFYQIIHPSADDPVASESLRAEWAKDGYEIDLDRMKENLRAAFPEKSILYGIKF